MLSEIYLLLKEFSIKNIIHRTIKKLNINSIDTKYYFFPFSCID